MKVLIAPLLVGLIVAFGPNDGASTNKDGLPTLHKISKKTLSPSYSCRASGEHGKGYENTGLFLSEFSKTRNSPELLFDGACGAEDVFKVSTAGDDMALIADLGADVPIEDVTAHAAFNLKNVAAPKYYSKFTRTAEVRPGHTYAVIINKSEIRGLFIFKVIGYKKNSKVDIEYAVKSYQMIKVIDKSDGFNWNQESTS